MITWKEIKTNIKNKPKASDITMNIYKKVASCNTNQLFTIKPTYYLGSIYVSALDYIDYVDSLLQTKEKDFSNFFKLLMYLRESSKTLLANIGHLEDPLEMLIQHIEEIYEAEEYEDEAEHEEVYEEEEEEEGHENIDIEDNAPEEEEDFDPGSGECHREDFVKEREELTRDLRVKLGEICENNEIISSLAEVTSSMYLECIQFVREVARLYNAPDGDLATILSILIDMQFGLEVLLKGYITEDIIKDEEYDFNLGFLIWSAHCLNELMNKLSEENYALVS
ncbi:MAG: hypothetical protein ABIH00_00285 [Armatimonadota bacterium]